MKFYCCGLIYNTLDPETYWCIDKYILKKPVDKFIRGKKILKQIVYTLCCKKHGCFKLEIHSYAAFDKSKDLRLVSVNPIKGEGARTFFETIKDVRIKQPQICPFKKISFSESIPWVYGKVEDGLTQSRRYLDESGYQDRNFIESKITVIDMYGTKEQNNTLEFYQSRIHKRCHTARAGTKIQIDRKSNLQQSVQRKLEK